MIERKRATSEPGLVSAQMAAVGLRYSQQFEPRRHKSDLIDNSFAGPQLRTLVARIAHQRKVVFIGRHQEVNAVRSMAGDRRTSAVHVVDDEANARTARATLLHAVLRMDKHDVQR